MDFIKNAFDYIKYEKYRKYIVDLQQINNYHLIFSEAIWYSKNLDSIKEELMKYFLPPVADDSIESRLSLKCRGKRTFYHKVPNNENGWAIINWTDFLRAYKIRL